MFPVFLLFLLLSPNDGVPRITLTIQDFSDLSNQRVFLADKGKNRALVHAFMESLSTKLSYRFLLVEREKLDTILREQELTKKGLVTRNAAKPDLTGATFLLTGSIISFNHESHTFKGYNMTYETNIYDMVVVYKIVNTSTGEVVHLDKKAVREKIRGAAINQDVAAGRLAEAMTKEVADGIDGFFKDQSDSLTEKNERERGPLLTISSRPEGADVEIDGIYKGVTPLTLHIQPGLHRVKISRAGYQDWAKKIQTAEDMSINPILAMTKEKE